MRMKRSSSGEISDLANTWLEDSAAAEANATTMFLRLRKRLGKCAG
jgi:hypothetical protein